MLRYFKCGILTYDHKIYLGDKHTQKNHDGDNKSGRSGEAACCAFIFKYFKTEQMIKVFLGNKSVLISSVEVKSDPRNTKKIVFESAEVLHREYKHFSRSSSIKCLIISGDERTVWPVFRSLFAYIEASGGVVRNGEGELLMIYRNRHWDLPKGRMEKGEMPDQTALREVEEECGVNQLEIGKELMSTHHVFFQDKHEWIKRTYWYEMTCRDTSKPRPQAEEGILKAEWMKGSEVRKVWNKIYPSLQEVLTAASF